MHPLRQVTEEILTSGYEEHSDYGSLTAAMNVDEGLLHESRTATQLTHMVRHPKHARLLTQQQTHIFV